MTRYRVASASELPAGEIARVLADGKALCLAHVAGRGFFAVDDRCTHEDTELSDGYLDGVELECPLHGSRFDVTTGEVIGLPATESTTVYPVEVAGDDVIVEL